MARPRCNIRHIKKCVDTKEVIANEEDSFIQREQQIRKFALLSNIYTYAYTTYIRDLDMQFMRSEIRQDR